MLDESSPAIQAIGSLGTLKLVFATDLFDEPSADGLYGVKMVLPSSVYPEAWGGHFPTGWSLGIIVGVIGASMAASLMVKPKGHSPAA